VAIEAGEIWVRSPSLMRGYFEAPEETVRVLVDGWLRTGDLGAVEGGSLFITGREKDLLIKAGRKFHPAEIEELVARTVDTPPNGVAAFNDEEALVLVIEQRRIQAEPDSAAVRALIVEHLGVRVDRVQWVTAGSLPRTTSGKLRRAACAELFGAPA
jgi:acyl-CoA synthetase (AMP-forming)/AMP-acid ligase II